MEEKDTQSTKRPKIIIDEFDGKYQNEAGVTWEIVGNKIILYLVGSREMGIEYSEDLISSDIQDDIKILRFKYSESTNINDVTLTINKYTRKLIEHDENGTYEDMIYNKK